MKRFFQILIWSVLTLAVVAALAFAEMKHRETICKGFELVIIDENPSPLIKADEIRKQVIMVTDTLIGEMLGDIDLHKINDILEEIPFIAASDIQSSISGYLKVEVNLRRAVIRIINKKGFNYYIDAEGWIIPVNPGHPSRIVIANGSINDGISDLPEGKMHISSLPASSPVRNLFKMAIKIDGSPFLKKLITQIWIDKNKELELTPMLGEYTLKFGGFDEMEGKFEKIETFYREGAGKAGWIDYRSVDLRYKNQIICSKK